MLSKSQKTAEFAKHSSNQPINQPTICAVDTVHHSLEKSKFNPGKVDLNPILKLATLPQPHSPLLPGGLLHNLAGNISDRLLSYARRPSRMWHTHWSKSRWNHGWTKHAEQTLKSEWYTCSTISNSILKEWIKVTSH